MPQNFSWVPPPPGSLPSIFPAAWAWRGALHLCSHLPRLPPARVLLCPPPRLLAQSLALGDRRTLLRPCACAHVHIQQTDVSNLDTSYACMRRARGTHHTSPAAVLCGELGSRVGPRFSGYQSVSPWLPGPHMQTWGLLPSALPRASRLRLPLAVEQLKPGWAAWRLGFLAAGR